MPINAAAALYKFAQQQNLSYPQTDEFKYTFNGVPYIAQVFNLGIVYVKDGDFGNVKFVRARGCVEIAAKFGREKVRENLDKRTSNMLKSKPCCARRCSEIEMPTLTEVKADSFPLSITSRRGNVA